jgi:hypothetical protein
MQDVLKEFLSDALSALLVLAIPFVYWQLVKLANAAAAWAAAYSAEKDFGMVDAAIEGAVQWVEVYCRELKGVDKLRAAVARLEKMGVEVDEAEVERIYQALAADNRLAIASTKGAA